MIAQRRPGRESRRHELVTAGSSGGSTALNEGRDVNPGDTHPRVRTPSAPASLNEGRDVNPGDTQRHGRGPAGAVPLNEGRDVNPGDTRRRTERGASVRAAQRRPGRESRRHFSLTASIGRMPAGAQRRPGRESRRHIFKGSPSQVSFYPAQRRPGRESRRHLIRCVVGLGLAALRSTKAGT